MSVRFWLLLTSALMPGLLGCHDLTRQQREDILHWESEVKELGHPEIRYEEVKSPTKAAWLGLLPGVGGFYTHRPGLGVAGILCWPISAVWEPPLAYSSAHEYNYRLFRERVMAVHDEAFQRQAAGWEASSPSRTLPPSARVLVPGHGDEALDERLQQLDQMHREGTITDDEYRVKRKQVLDETLSP